MEEKIDKDRVFSMAVGDIEALAADSGGEAAAGKCKIISDYVWYYAALMDSETAAKFAVGDALTLAFNYDKIPSLPAEVAEIRLDDRSGRAAVILECAILNSSITELRLEDAKISFLNHSGIVVNRGALRIEDGVLGVYVKYGSTIIFKRVHTIYETDDYVVSLPDNSDPDRLAVYDEIIVEGKDLYVGKTL
jgi:hypothetical protein